MPATPLIRLEAYGIDLRGTPTPEGVATSNQAAELLAEYQQHRSQSIVGRIMAAARKLQGRVDGLIILGNEADLLPARALFQAGCHPYHNELCRGERAGYPRIYFAGDRWDNDGVQGLLFLLGNGREAEDVERRWGMVLVERSNDCPLKSLFLERLRSSCGGDEDKLNERMIVIHPADGNGATSDGDCPAFQFVDDDAAALSPLGLLPAALMGLDILRMLQGACQMKNPVEAAALRRSCEIRWWDNSLAGIACWMQQLAPSTKAPQTALRVNLLVEHPRCDPLENLPALLQQEIDAARESDRAAGRPFVDIILPSTQIGVLGQLFQFWQAVAEVA